MCYYLSLSECLYFIVLLFVCLSFLIRPIIVLLSFANSCIDMHAVLNLTWLFITLASS